jgi:hypothetical protein
MSFFQHSSHACSGTSGWSKVTSRLPTRLHSWQNLLGISCACWRQSLAITWLLRSARYRHQLAARVLQLLGYCRLCDHTPTHSDMCIPRHLQLHNSSTSLDCACL